MAITDNAAVGMLVTAVGLPILAKLVSAKEKPMFPIDPNDPNIEQKLIDASLWKFQQKFPEVQFDLSCQPCNGINQDPTKERPKWFTVAVGIEASSGRYTAMVECDEVTEWTNGNPAGGVGWFRMNFYLDTGEILPYVNGCSYINPDRTYYWKCDKEDNCYEGPM